MTTFAFNNAIPASGNNPSADQPEMLTNNISTAGLVAVDHIGFNLSNGGYHTVIHFEQQASDPAAIGTFGQLYTKQVTSGGNTDEALFYESGGGRITQLTTNPNGAGAVGSATADGWTTLPTGMIIQWGKVSATPGLSGPFNFPITFPNACFSISLAMNRSNTSSTNYDIFLDGAPNPGDFSLNSGTSNTHDVYFIAIGN